jgi:hypothetical protein
MSDDAGHISMETRERALTFIESAEKISFTHDSPLYTAPGAGGKDYMYFAFTDGMVYIFLFCTPEGYLVETHDTDVEGATLVNYAVVKNVRNYIFWLVKSGMEGLQSYFNEIKKSSGLSDEELDKKIQEYKDGQDEE